MMSVVSRLPEGVELSQHLCKKAEKRRYGRRKWAFFRIGIYGSRFYVPITNEMWDLFGLKDSDFSEYDDEDLDTGRKIKMVECNKHGVEELLRQVFDAVALQVRDNVLSGMEQGVMQEVIGQVRKALHAPIRGMIEKAADERLARELPGSVPPKEVADGKRF